MGWSIKLGTVGGTEIRVHLTFFILLLWIGLMHAAEGSAAAIEGIVFVIAIFACVLLHELGHATAARRYGIKTPDITLLPIGGVARLEKMPEKPREEIVVALAGPLVNVVIAAVIILAMGGLPDPAALEGIAEPEIGFWTRLAAINIFLVVFNMIPAFPMDGGRVLRALLAMRMGRVKATEWAAKIGQALAFAFGFLGLMGGNPILVFIAIFVYLAAMAEAQTTGLMDVAKRMTAGEAMITRFEPLGPQSTLKDAGDILIHTTQHEFPVIDGSGRLRGLLTRRQMVAAMAESGPQTSVLDAMVEIPETGAATRLDQAITKMQKANAPAVAVVDGSEDGRFLGYITPENISEVMMLREADGLTLGRSVPRIPQSDPTR